MSNNDLFEITSQNISQAEELLENRNKGLFQPFTESLLGLSDLSMELNQVFRAPDGHPVSRKFSYGVSSGIPLKTSELGPLKTS